MIRLPKPTRYQLNESSEYCEECYEGDYSNEDHFGYSFHEGEEEFSDCTDDETSILGGDVKSGPMISTDIPSLKCISALRVAFALWCHLHVPSIVSEVTKKIHSDLGCLLQEKIQLYWEDELSLPNALVEPIQEHIISIKSELKRWISYHFAKVFFNYKTKNCLYALINHMVWHPNGMIDRKQTALSLLKSNRLSAVEKYRLLCLYCLKDEIELLSSCMFANDFDYVKFSLHPLIFYWNSYLKNSLDKIPVTRGMSIDAFMFNYPRVDNWPAKEYFFERMSSEDQVQNAISFIDKCGPKHQKLLLMKLNDSQRLLVFMDRAVEIMENYAQSQDNTQDLISTWNEIRNLINRDQMVSVFKMLLIQGADTSILKDVWINISDDFKNHLLEYNQNEIIADTLESWVDNSDNDLFFTLMSDTTADFRKRITKEWFFPKHCVKLMSTGQLPMLDKLIKVCLPIDQESINFKKCLIREDFFISYCKQLIFEGNLNFLDHLLQLFVPKAAKAVQFKQDLTNQNFFVTHCENLVVHDRSTQLHDLLNSFLPELQHQVEFKKHLLINSNLIKRHCLTFFKTGNAENLNNFLFKLLPTSSNVVIEFKKTLLLSNEGKNTCIPLVDSETDLSGIISDCLPPEMASEFKKELIFAPSVISNFNTHIRSNLIKRVTKSIDRYVSSAEDRIALKKLIVGNPIDLMRAIFRKFDEPVWNSIMMWWLEDEENMYDFMSTLPLDNVFDEMLKECIFSIYDPAHRLNKCKFRPDYGFVSLDRFLNWYFDSPAKIKEYKLHRVDSYMEIDTIKTLLKKKDDTYLKAVMNWFFEGNTADIDRFKMKNRGRKILNVL